MLPRPGDVLNRRGAASRLGHDMRNRFRPPALQCCSVLTLASILTGCASKPPRVGQQVPRKGDEIMVAGQLFHTGTPVVLWTDPGGYDAYRTERRFAPWDEVVVRAPPRRRVQRHRLAQPLRRARAGPHRRGARAGPRRRLAARLLQEKVDQFVIHYDVVRHEPPVLQGPARPARAERAVHARHRRHDLPDVRREGTPRGTRRSPTPARSASRSPTSARTRPTTRSPLNEWYATDETGRRTSRCPRASATAASARRLRRSRRSATRWSSASPRPTYRQYDFTPQQYDSLIKLTAALCTVLPSITCDYPRDERGQR